MHTEPALRPWRRHLRISLRGLIVLVLVIAAGIGWIVRQARLQREAVAAINNARGTPHYDTEVNAGSYRNKLSAWKKRIGERIGIDYVDHVVSVELSSRVNKADWRQAADRLRDLDQLQYIYLMGSFVNDDVLEHLEGMNRLELLSLQFAGITDAGLAHVRNLTNLKRVYIDGNRIAGSGITDAGLAHLKGLYKLSTLSLQATQVSDAGLAHLQGLTNLSELNLSETKVSDRGLAHLAALTKLSGLWLRGTLVSDAGLAHLKGLTNLSVLDLVRTQVSDAGLAHLKGLPKLKVLVLDHDRVSKDAIKELTRALPSLRIDESF
jgi:internalin A